jgi:hypothetical protein
MDFNDYFNSSIEQVWNKCLPIWKEAGRVEDFPHGMRRGRYMPSFGKSLGIRFAEIYYEDIAFAIQKLSSHDSVEVICALGILELIAWQYDYQSLQLPQQLLDIEILIPEPAISEIKSEIHFQEFNGRTIGEFLPFMIENS